LKLLVDECLPKKFKTILKEYDAWTVQDLNITGIKNGKLLEYASEQGFFIGEFHLKFA